ncbi:MAG TPA: GTPase Era [Candidatus Stackebrandtia faecavium]|nr:GTPase Era [Candidatus Stackebrandtia faecavium]
MTQDEYRAGFACFVGRPNAGKSTLTNAIVGSKVAITSDRPQTTRHVVRGVVHRENSQVILVDTPGFHKPKTLLGERLNDQVRQIWGDVDVVGMCVPANEKIGPGDRFIYKQISGLKVKKIAIVTKTDLVSKARLAEQLVAVNEMGDFADIVPCSGTSGEQLDVVIDVLSKHMPVSPQLYPDDMWTDEPERVMIAELVREAALEGVQEELPHSIAVLIEEIEDEDTPDGPRKKIYAEIYVERSSQKAIIIGKGGSRLRVVGTRARKEIAKLIGSRVYLDLHVRVAKDWQRNPKHLQRLGF